MKQLIEQFKEKLEWELDEQFPKGKCKERGNALVLYVQAVILFERCLKELENTIPNKNDKNSSSTAQVQQNKKGCGLLISYEGSKKIKCGDRMFGKVRLCDFCNFNQGCGRSLGNLGLKCNSNNLCKKCQDNLKEVTK